MATMLDVSRKVGVSKSTVSRVLNGKGRVSEATRREVFKAIEELDYRPNVLAQSLSKQATDTIGLIIPRCYNISQYISQLIEVSQTLADESGKFLMITQANMHEGDYGLKSIRNLVDRRCDGILYYKSSHIEGEHFQRELENLIDEIPIPLVVLNYCLPDKPDNCVWFDHVATGRLAVEHLIAQGHRRIAYISGSLNIRTSRLRMQGYQDALKDAGIELNPLLITEGDGHYNGGYTACKQLIQRKLDFTAICCFNDTTAIGALKALNEHGISVPEDVSLFGFDNESVLDYITPSISSVALPVEKIADYAANLLFSHLNKTDILHLEPHAICGELVLRNSVKKLK
ncbi:LacI family DNA-binding transcriptional regulator [Vibrio mangrovi]|uniref:HTH-type transcriptional regulator AscG n=1 Tax=Vibrio mangrovi TaxID=474394 RepID=A0A1Y6IYA9_9VIBR|nr:LacI family DNA-binding transcriptional regulator [Vibrio mangrovi]MDW6002470.1 LacI family DNA-binding transcriptional regulator [Vibrio mangrovi]SMS02001.1 HTH-type transcriptional regulator AscG [Vibrio mangrovi]